MDVSAEVIEADTDWADENSLKLFYQDEKEFEFLENFVKMSPDYKEFVNVGEPTEPSLKSGHNGTALNNSDLELAAMSPWSWSGPILNNLVSSK